MDLTKGGTTGAKYKLQIVVFFKTPRYTLKGITVY